VLLTVRRAIRAWPRRHQALLANLDLRVLWLASGIEGDDTGPRDDFVRFVAPGRSCSAEKQRDPNQACCCRARTARRATRGTELEIVRLPIPAAVAFAGQGFTGELRELLRRKRRRARPTFEIADRRASILAELFPIGTLTVLLSIWCWVSGLCCSTAEPAGRPVTGSCAAERA
jgi:hypothetical protein